MKKEYLNGKASRNQPLYHESQRNHKHLDCLLCKTLGTISKMDEKRPSINGSEKKKVNDNAWGPRKGGKELASIEDSENLSKTI